jgi:hypothetical protein
MSSEFWIGMAVSAIIGLLGNVFANLYHPKISSFFNARKSISVQRNRAKALREYRLIEDFHEGRRNWHYHLMRLMAVYVVFNVIAFILLGVTIIILALGPDLPFSFDLLLTKPYRKHYSGIGSLFLLSFVMAILGVIIGRQSLTISNALEDFTSYKAAFEAKWGVAPYDPKPSAQ